MAKKKECCEKNQFVGIAGTIGGIMVAIVAIFLIFAKEWSWVLTPITISMCVMGVFLGYFAYKKK